ncbi:hypothetical protein PtB15_18B143 [Puccinia triticina]|nr:hypothetical protein PtB15_18B143 [Puccinia triticina]
MEISPAPLRPAHPAKRKRAPSHPSHPRQGNTQPRPAPSLPAGLTLHPAAAASPAQLAAIDYGLLAGHTDAAPFARAPPKLPRQQAPPRCPHPPRRPADHHPLRPPGRRGPAHAHPPRLRRPHRGRARRRPPLPGLQPHPPLSCLVAVNIDGLDYCNGDQEESQEGTDSAEVLHPDDSLGALRHGCKEMSVEGYNQA